MCVRLVFLDFIFCPETEEYVLALYDRNWSPSSLAVSYTGPVVTLRLGWFHVLQPSFGTVRLISGWWLQPDYCIFSCCTYSWHWLIVFLNACRGPVACEVSYKFSYFLLLRLFIECPDPCRVSIAYFYSFMSFLKWTAHMWWLGEYSLPRPNPSTSSIPFRAL